MSSNIMMIFIHHYSFIYPFIYPYAACRVGKSRSQDSKEVMSFEDEYDPDF